MNPQCDRCTQLLLDYIAAGNHLIDIRDRIRHSDSGERSSGSELLAIARTAREAARKHLLTHQHQPCCCQCPNRVRNPHATVTAAAQGMDRAFLAANASVTARA
jgi:hypothetical protein